MNKSLQIDFTDIAWSKMREMKIVIFRMLQSRVDMIRLFPDLIGLFEWFWRNKDQFKIWMIANGKKEELIF